MSLNKQLMDNILMLKILLTPLMFIFHILVRIKNWLYHFGILKPHKINIPVISIGNIAFGGTGKTPLVIDLCNQLKAKGYKPAVISRGYKRKSSGLVVVHNGQNAHCSVDESGDEPFLIAKKLVNVPVVVCKKREQAAEYIMKTFSDVNIILLDDGFQYRKLHRDIDIVLLSGKECNGILREPKSSLKRADMTLALDKQYSVCEFENDKLTPNKPTKGVYAFCGIANPKSFLQYLDDEKIEIKWKTIYNDHHDYSEKSMTKLKDTINQTGANSIITTEKDLVKLPTDFLEQYQIYIVTLSIKFEDDTIYNKIFKGLESL